MKTLSKSLTLFSMLFMLFACGGGGGSLERESSSGNTGGGTGTTTDPTYTVTLALTDQGGETDRDLSSDNPLTLTATVVDQDGAALADTLITFTLSNENLAVFSNDTGTARTNDSGVATINLTAGTASGDGLITATLPDGTTQSTTFSASAVTVVTEDPAEVEFYASSVQLPSSGSDSIELIALVKNAQSVLMEGVEVSFSAAASAGVELQQVDDLTLENGTATALLTTSNNAGNRTVTITATAGDVVRTLDIEIAGTEVTINGSRSITVGDSTVLTLRVQDSDGTNIPNQTIALTTNSGSLSASQVTTGTNGQATVTFTGDQSGSALITATALGASSEFSVTVQEDDFTFTVVPAEEVAVAPDNAYEDADYTTLTIRWNKENAAYAGGNVTFTASRGDIRSGDESGTTDASGLVSFDIASTNAGISSITATGEDATGNEVTATVEIEFIATDAEIMYVDASPDIIGPDGQTSTISAIVRDPAGNLVKNKVVSFNVNDTSTGTISPSQATTDSNGIASTVFTSSAVTSEEFVLITATVVDEPEVTGQVTMTVGNRAFDVSIGTGNLLQAPDDTTYIKQFAVFVTDSAGRPIEGVELTASVTPVKVAAPFFGEYRKGNWTWADTVWVRNYTAICSNEDTNGNGMLDPFEDTNQDTYLTPGIVGSISFAGGIDTTDANGRATLELHYPREYGAFYDSEVTIYAQSTGSESRASMIYDYEVLASDLTNENVPPPVSPFGTSANCDDFF